jgi:adenylate kinase family enzyme
MRVAIVGNSGSGKSTLARRLGEVHSLSTLDLDTVSWEPGLPAVPRGAAAAAADVRAFCEVNDRWVVEGCYGNLVRVALERSPVLVFLDPGVEARLANCRARPWEPHKYASREEQDTRLEFLLVWVEQYYSRTDALSLADHEGLFDAYAGTKMRLAHEPDRGFVEVQPLRWFCEEATGLGPRFEACAIPAKAWTHAAHLSTGLWHVERYGRKESLDRLRAGIRRLNESHGGVNSATAGYHETITAVFVELLAQFLERRPEGESLGDTIARLLGGPLAQRGALFAFYSRERLMSTEARAAWVEPDLAPLDLTAILEPSSGILQRPTEGAA